VVVAFDVKPDRSGAAIAVAGVREDGRRHGGIIDHRPGTQWVVPRLLELMRTERDIIQFKCDKKGPAGSLLDACEEAGVHVDTINTEELAEACGQMYDDVVSDQFRHRGGVELTSAVRGASRRPLGDRWAWSRKSSKVDICPLVAVTIARHGVAGHNAVPLVAWR
jgi:hypothetical protein